MNISYGKILIGPRLYLKNNGHILWTVIGQKPTFIIKNNKLSYNNNIKNNSKFCSLKFVLKFIVTHLTMVMLVFPLFQNALWFYYARKPIETVDLCSNNESILHSTK